MAKFTGLVGYVTQVETVPDVWSSDETPVLMKGDIISQTSSNRNDSKVNGDIIFNHRISLIGDAYAFSNYYNIKWIEIDGFKWEVASVEVRRPRLIVAVGGVYNG